ncbi:MAG TPA: cytochrome c [Burkholderiales bacterium]|nr:cytochrome c [Burkholderiales bacterium]
MKTNVKKIALAVAALGLTACVTPSVADKASITLPQETAHFKQGPGSDVTTIYCTICHTADYVYMQPPQNRAGWEATVTKMRKVMGAPASDADAKIIVDYLMTQNSRQ